MCLLERGLPPACRARNHLCDTNAWGCSQSVQGGKKRRAVSVAVAPFRARGRVQLPQVEHITRITDPSLARHAASCSLGALPAAQVARSAGFRAPVASTQPRLVFEKKRILGLTSNICGQEPATRRGATSPTGPQVPRRRRRRFTCSLPRCWSGHGWTQRPATTHRRGDVRVAKDVEDRLGGRRGHDDEQRPEPHVRLVS